LAPKQLRQKRQPTVSSWDCGKLMEKSQLPHPVLTASILFKKTDGLGDV